MVTYGQSSNVTCLHCEKVLFECCFECVGVVDGSEFSGDCVPYLGVSSGTVVDCVCSGFFCGVA